MKETKEEKILRHKEMIKEIKHRLRTDKSLADFEYFGMKDEIRGLIIKIANLNGMTEIKNYDNIFGFKRDLVNLIFEADKKNLEKLKKAYPKLVNICRGTQI